MLPAQVGNRDAGLVLLQNSDDLLFRKAAALHALVLVVGQNELQTGLSPWGKVRLATTRSDDVGERPATVTARRCRSWQAPIDILVQQRQEAADTIGDIRSVEGRESAVARNAVRESL